MLEKMNYSQITADRIGRKDRFGWHNTGAPQDDIEMSELNTENDKSELSTSMIQYN